MEIKGKVHCFFEQSGTFKNEFIKLGIPAEDYDIQNNFEQTDHVVDLFHEIEEGYEGRASLFDSITRNDLILAFFPCIYFCNYSDFNQREINNSIKNWPIDKIWAWKLKRSQDRQHFYELALKMTAIVEIRNLRMVVENPWSIMNYTNFHWFNKPSFIDYNRRLRGDYFIKPTAYWFINCQHTNGHSFQKPKKKLRIVKYGGGDDVAKGSGKAGLCSEERSLISPDYARNFICDFIIGREQPEINKQLEFKF